MWVYVVPRPRHLTTRRAATSEWPYASLPPLRPDSSQACDPHGNGHTSLPTARATLPSGTSSLAARGPQPGTEAVTAWQRYTLRMPRFPTSIDTVDAQTVDILRQRGVGGRLEMAFSMWRSARDIITAILVSQHPDWSDDQVAAEVARRLSHGAC